MALSLLTILVVFMSFEYIGCTLVEPMMYLEGGTPTSIFRDPAYHGDSWRDSFQTPGREIHTSNFYSTGVEGNSFPVPSKMGGGQINYFGARKRRSAYRSIQNNNFGGRQFNNNGGLQQNNWGGTFQNNGRINRVNNNWGW
jgi:hypothetical protein